MARTQPEPVPPQSELQPSSPRRPSFSSAHQSSKSSTAAAATSTLKLNITTAFLLLILVVLLFLSNLTHARPLKPLEPSSNPAHKLRLALDSQVLPAPSSSSSPTSTSTAFSKPGYHRAGAGEREGPSVTSSTSARNHVFEASAHEVPSGPNPISN